MEIFNANKFSWLAESAKIKHMKNNTQQNVEQGLNS